ncbi:hypothetical protein ASPBRDRAFT_31185 [Aspergillus brasiliensis CBS 101740]|uniref:Uncharacterized protein n=1 Tax=Aspergillus brasiliensis (strain CBS 101740 / IMI 381727 / IBT 21946) TaxID=767769 RepID=A0A1L9UF52_ASPBC|nr:hypothetical protein ASPBRDRAFT_31185 [Aspergillus brasiliensis CBS 101740]
MNSSPPAIVTAFNEKLPSDVAYAFREPYRVIRSTASSTIDTDPVAVYFEEEICPGGTRLVCRTKTSTSSTSRFDVEWSLYDVQNVLLSRLAILEIKNTHVIRKIDFQRAAVNEQNFQAKLTSAMAADGMTLLRSNATWLLKQAQKYSEHCPYVAIFDYNAMFIFSFLRQSTKPVRGFYFDESGRTSGMNFRRLLFAFVSRALKGYEARLPQGP